MSERIARGRINIIVTNSETLAETTFERVQFFLEDDGLKLRERGQMLPVFTWLDALFAGTEVSVAGSGQAVFETLPGRIERGPVNFELSQQGDVINLRVADDTLIRQAAHLTLNLHGVRFTESRDEALSASGGSANLFGQDIPLTAVITESGSLSFHLPEQTNEANTLVLPELGQLTLTTLDSAVNENEQNWELAATGNVTLENMAAPLDAPFPATIDFSADECRLSIDESEMREIAPDFGFTHIHFNWQLLDEESIWRLLADGRVSLTIFRQTVTLQAQRSTGDGERPLTFSLNSNISLPLPELGVVDFEQLTLGTSLENPAEWEIQVNGAISFTVFPAPLDGPFAIELLLQNEQLQLAIHTAERLQIIENFSLDDINLTFSLGRESWAVAGSVQAHLFDAPPFELAAGFAREADRQRLTLSQAAAADMPLLQIDPTLSLTTEQLQLSVAAAESGDLSWQLTSTSTLDAPDVFHLTGSLTLFSEAGDRGLAFAPDAGSRHHAFSVPLVADAETMILRVGFSLTHLSIIRGEDNEWFVQTTTGMSLAGLPAEVDAALPDTIETIFTADGNGVSLSPVFIENGENEPPVTAVIPLHALTINEETIDLGQVTFAAGNFTITLGRTNTAVAAELTVQLPPQLDNMFGTNDQGQPLHNLIIDEIILGLEINRQTGLQLQLQSSIVPPAWGHVEENEDGILGQRFELGQFGRLWFRLPTFSYDGRAFTAAGAFNHENLSLPLAPIKNLLNEQNLSAVTDLIPDSLPLNEINILDENGDLDVNALTAVFLDNELAQTSDLPLAELNEAITFLAGRFNQLPDAFQEYLRYAIPNEFAYDITFSPDGNLRVNIEAGADDPVKFLQAALIPGAIPMPGFRGIQLHRLAFGPVLSGSAHLLEADVIIDDFDILTLAGTLALPEVSSQLLPDSRQLHQRYIMRDLTSLIVTQTGIPLPIPLFFGDLGISYLGLPGLGSGLQGQFPQPDNFDFLDVISLALEMKEFFLEKDHLLPADFFSQHDLDLRFSVKPAYLQLPKYVSGDEPIILGKKDEELWSIDLSANLAQMLNTIKNPRLGRLVRLLPLARRVGSEAVSFGPLDFEAAWAVTTDKEYQDELLNAAPDASLFLQALNELSVDERQNLLSLIQFDPQHPATAQDDGAVALLLGRWAVADLVNFDVRLGLAQSSSMGDGFGFHIGGGVTDFMNFEAEGGVVINSDNHNQPLLLNGRSQLTMFDHPLFSGDIQLDGEGFVLDGRVDLFPTHSPLQVGGQGLVNINNDGSLHLLTEAEVTLPDFQLVDSRLELDNHALSLRGNWLGQEAVFRSLKQEKGLQLQGEVDFDFIIKNLHTGPIHETGTSWRMTENLVLKETGLAASLKVVLGSRGFEAEVNGSFVWEGQQFIIPAFTIYTSPRTYNELQSILIEAIKTHKDTIFADHFFTVADWLEAAKNGAVQLANPFLPLLEAAKAWTLEAWTAVKSWSAAAWETTKWWTAAAWQATTGWVKEAWHASQAWTAAAWQALTRWGTAAWQATTTWPAAAWQATVKWTADTWQATTEWADDVWAATAVWAAMSAAELENALANIASTVEIAMNESLLALQAVLNDAIQGVRDVVDEIDNVVRLADGSIQEVLNGVDAAVHFGEKSVSAIAHDLDVAVRTAENSIQDVLNGVDEAVRFGDKTVGAIANEIDTAVTTINSAVRFGNKTVGTMANDIKTAVATVNSAVRFGEKTVGTIANDLDTAVRTADDSIQVVLGGVNTTVGQVNSAVRFGNKTVGKLASEIDSTLDKVNSAVRIGDSSIKNLVNDMSPKVKNTNSQVNLMKPVVDGIEATVNFLKDPIPAG